MFICLGKGSLFVSLEQTFRILDFICLVEIKDTFAANYSMPTKRTGDHAPPKTMNFLDPLKKHALHPKDFGFKNY